MSIHRINKKKPTKNNGGAYAVPVDVKPKSTATEPAEGISVPFPGKAPRHGGTVSTGGIPFEQSEHNYDKGGF